MKRALITGCGGQDAITLANYLIGNKGYKVYATSRRTARPQSRFVLELLAKYPEQYSVIEADLTDMSSIINAIEIAQPDEFYNLAAQSFVGGSFYEPISTSQITGIGVLNCLEAIRKTNKNIKFYQASSSEMFGGTKNTSTHFANSNELTNCVVINETTPFQPRSPYACAKVFGHNITNNYKEAYGIFACCGILFNHEGIYRKPEFVTRKITIAVNKIAHGLQNKVKLGTLDFARDWGHAEDYCEAMYLMLQQSNPDNYVIATGTAKTGKELLEEAFGYYNLDWNKFVELDAAFSRPSDVAVLIGDASYAKTKLGWEPRTSFKQLIKLMMDNDCKLIETYGEIRE